MYLIYFYSILENKNSSNNLLTTDKNYVCIFTVYIYIFYCIYLNHRNTYKNYFINLVNIILSAII